MSSETQRRQDIPTRLVIFHRSDTFYPIMVYSDETQEQLGDHASLNPGTLKITDAVTGETLWALQ